MYELPSWSTQVRKGLIELCVLAALREGETYGYEVIQRLELAGMPVGEGSIYPLLARLAHDGALAVRVVPSNAGPPRRYYRLTAAGQKRLDAMRQSWSEVRDIVEKCLHERPRELRAERNH